MQKWQVWMDDYGYSETLSVYEVSQVNNIFFKNKVYYKALMGRTEWEILAMEGACINRIDYFLLHICLGAMFAHSY